MIRIILFFTLLEWTSSQTCSVPKTEAFTYHAPPREVPYPQVDERLKREFLLLFDQSEKSREIHKVGPLSHHPPIDPDIIKRINLLCGRNQFFYNLAPRHQQAVMLLRQVFTEQPTPEELLRVAREQLNRHEINPRIWYYALVGTFLSRPDLNGYYAAWAIDATPDLFLTWPVIREAIHGYARSSGRCIPSNGTRGATRNVENELWYFREDLQLNQKHWYWHQYYPQSSPRHADRRGEVFFYYHHSLIARYNAERIGNGLEVEDELDLQPGGIIPVGYYPEMREMVSGMFWIPRDANVQLQDTHHGNDPDIELEITLKNISHLHSLLNYHIDHGFLIANQSIQSGRTPTEHVLDIRDIPGLTHLGNTVEAADDNLNVNPAIYHEWGIHNMAHIIVAMATDPSYIFKLPPGVLADLSASLRDPSFYLVHTLIDGLYKRYKRMLPPYQISGGEWPLVWPGVKMISLDVSCTTPNLLDTFWQVKQFPLEGGVDGSIHDGSIKVDICQKHLNHTPFSFTLEVDVDSCWESESGRGTVRLFMAPRLDANGKRFSINEQRKLMFPMDSFPVELRPGKNYITRKSTDSSITNRWTRSLQEMISDPSNGGSTEYCGCGWPQHLFIPKSTKTGMQFDLFAMITNYDADRVEDIPSDLEIPEPCNSPHIVCGVPYRKYPDARPMGYPFDRQAYYVNHGVGLKQVSSLEEYVSRIPNAGSRIITIKHSDVNNVIG